MANVNIPRIQRWFAQQQTTYLAFNNSSGTWNSSGAQMLRVDQGSVTTTRNAPYSRLPVLTGTREDVAGVRGRKGAAWSIRGLPIIPSGVSAQAPDTDILWQNIFGQASSGGTYSALDSGFLPFSLFGFTHGVATLTQRALWGCFVSRVTYNFNGLFLTCDLDGFAGYIIDNIGFSAFDSQAKAALTAFPLEPSSPTVSGTPIAGFGTGYTATLHSQTLELKVRVMSISVETGFVPVGDVYGSPYTVEALGDARRVALRISAIDDDSTALNDLKTQCDTDNTTITASIVAGNVTNSKFTFNLNAIQPNAFNLRDNGPAMEVELPDSYAHATAVGNVDSFSMSFS